MKNILFTITMLIGAQGAMAMQLPSYWSAIKQEPASLTGMPADIKGHLISVIAQGDPETAAESIFSLAQTNKDFNALVNQLNPDYVIALLDGISDVPKAIKLVEKMQESQARLPVMRNPAIQAWLEEAKESLVNHHARLVREHRIEAALKIGIFSVWAGGSIYTAGKFADYMKPAVRKLMNEANSDIKAIAILAMAVPVIVVSGFTITAAPFALANYILNRR